MALGTFGVSDNVLGFLSPTLTQCLISSAKARIPGRWDLKEEGVTQEASWPGSDCWSLQQSLSHVSFALLSIWHTPSIADFLHWCQSFHCFFLVMLM